MLWSDKLLKLSPYCHRVSNSFWYLFCCVFHASLCHYCFELNVKTDLSFLVYRYYYDKMLLTKIPGQRYTYKFNLRVLMQQCKSSDAIRRIVNKHLSSAHKSHVTTQKERLCVIRRPVQETGNNGMVECIPARYTLKDTVMCEDAHAQWALDNETNIFYDYSYMNIPSQFGAQWKYNFHIGKLQFSHREIATCV